MLKLVKTDNRLSDDYRKGIRIGKERLAGIVRDDYSEEELNGLIMAVEVVFLQLHGKLFRLKSKRQHGILPKVVK